MLEDNERDQLSLLSLVFEKDTKILRYPVFRVWNPSILFNGEDDITLPCFMTASKWSSGRSRTVTSSSGFAFMTRRSAYAPGEIVPSKEDLLSIFAVEEKFSRWSGDHSTVIDWPAFVVAWRKISGDERTVARTANSSVCRACIEVRRSDPLNFRAVI